MDVSYQTNRYKATVKRWVDGDTVALMVDLGQHVCIEGNYRLLGIDAPETALRAGVTQEEKDRGRALTAMLTEMYPPGTTLSIATEKAGKYGRYLIDIWCYGPDDEVIHLNSWLVEQGHAVPYIG